MSESLSLRIDHRDEDGFALHVDLALPLTGITALFGPSGSGKTTVLDCIAGLRTDIHDADVLFGKEQWHGASGRRSPWERGVGYVFQDARLFPHLSVAANLDYAQRRARGPAPSREAVLEWLQIADILERRPSTLSAGQAQRVAIARALLGGPRLLLLDEPLANLDRAAAATCLQCLSRIAVESALPMLFVSHRIEEVGNIADRLVLLREGRVEAQGKLPELLSRLDSSLAEDEAAAAILVARVAGGERRYGLTELSASGQTLFVSSAAAPDSEQRVRIPARDVSVCRDRPQQTSILNILEVVLDSVRDVSATHCLLRLRLGEQFLLARITERSRRELQLEVGDRLFAQVKSSALLDERWPA